MSARSKRKWSFLNWRLCLQTSGIFRFPAIPDRYCFNRRGGAMPPRSGLAPESALRVHPCRALSSAPASTSVKEKSVLQKLVVVAGREK